MRVYEKGVSSYVLSIKRYLALNMSLYMGIHHIWAYES